MKIIPFKKSYYEEICEWWKAHDWEPVDEKMLPMAGFVVVDDDETKIACGWYGKGNCLTAFFEWIVGNPNVESKKIYEALSLLEDHVVKLAYEEGFEMLISFVNNDNLKKFLNSKRWIDADQKMDVYIKRLD